MLPGCLQHLFSDLQRQLTFLHSFSRLPTQSLPSLIFMRCLSNSPHKGFLPVLNKLVDALDLPSVPAILNGEWSKIAWKRWVKSLTMSAKYSSFLNQCDHLPLSGCSLRLGKPIPHWSVTCGLPKLTHWNNFCIRLLVGCDDLEADASRFRMPSNSANAVNNLSCKLCKSGPESPLHFIVRCSSLTCIRESLLCDLHFCIDLRSTSWCKRC